MSLLTISGVTIRIAGRLLLDNADLTVDHGRRIGLVGIPGTLDAVMTLPLIQWITLGGTVRGVVEGDSDPKAFLPELIAHHKAGRLPIEKFSKTYRLEDINQAIDDAHHGKCIKAVLLID